MARTAVGGFGDDDMAKVLALLGVLAAVGVLPARWKAPVGAAGAAYTLWRWLR